MKNKMKVGICKKCGPVELSGTTWTDAGEEAFMVPVIIAPTIQALGKVYSRFIGGTYKYNTGNKITDDFERKFMSLSHLTIDEPGWDEHMMEPLEVWNQII